MYNILKITLIAFYIVTLLSVAVSPLQPFQDWLVLITGILLVAHLGEYLVVKKQLHSVPGNHFLQVLLFGLLYWMPLLKNSKQSA